MPSPSGSGFSANGWFYNIADLANMAWFDGKYAFHGKFARFIAMQGGWELNSGQSYIGKINSQVFGAQIGANVTKNLVLSVGYDQIPWKTDTIFLPTGVTCSNSNSQVAAKATLAYFLPLNTAQCFTNPNGTTNIYYGGWASPYSDNTTSDPLYTTNFLQGQVDRRAPGIVVASPAGIHVDESKVYFPCRRRVVRLRQRARTAEHQNLVA